MVDLPYGAETDVSDRAVDADVARLRRKLSQMSEAGERVPTVHGAGHRFVHPTVRPIPE